MGVVDKLTGLFKGDDEDPYECISCGAGYETDRQFCPACGSTVERT